MPANQQQQIVSATRVHESAVIPAPIERVWEHVRPLQFEWLSTVASCAVTSGQPAEVGSVRKLSYKDGTVQELRLAELSDLKYYVTYDLLASEPAVSVSSALHTIRLHRVTADNTTFLEWISDFSNDVTAEVVQDSKYKKHEAVADLVKALAATGGKKTKATDAAVKSPAKKAKK